MRDLTTLIVSIVIGIGICILYDLFRIIRLGRKHSNFAIFIEDVFFFLIAGIITFFIQLVRCNGLVRCFVLIGETIGFIICRVTLSIFIMNISSKLIKFIKKVVFIIKKIIINPAKELIAFIKMEFLMFFSFLTKKVVKFIKKPLQPLAEMLYNVLHTKKKIRLHEEQDESGNSHMF